MMSTNFSPEPHTFRSPKFRSVVEDAIDFFESTPVHALPPPGRFVGAGIYALYYLGGSFELYGSIAARNLKVGCFASGQVVGIAYGESGGK